MIEKIEYKGIKYPKFQSEGYASQFVIPFAKKVCKGIGVDVGCNRLEWMYAGEICNKNNIINYDSWYSQAVLSSNQSNSFPIDPQLNKFDSTNFPENCQNLD